MQFTKKTRSGKLTTIGKFLIKVILVVFVLFLVVILISKIDFPAPNKKIEKIIPNENFKTIK
jgi:cell division protein FtsL